MMRAVAIARAGHWTAGTEMDRVVLDHDRRHRRRLRLTTEGGLDVLLDLPDAARLRDGDALLLEDDRLVAVAARPERLIEITAPPDREAAGADALVRIAWHLGNRHLPVQLLPGALRIRADHVIEEMARGLGGMVREIEAAFDPEAGAYAPGQHDDHHHHRDDGDDH